MRSPGNFSCRLERDKHRHERRADVSSLSRRVFNRIHSQSFAANQLEHKSADADSYGWAKLYFAEPNKFSPVLPLAQALKIPQSKMVSDFVTAGNRCRDKFLPDLNCLRQIISERERGADRGGISAACAVSAEAFYKRRG